MKLRIEKMFFIAGTPSHPPVTVSSACSRIMNHTERLNVTRWRQRNGTLYDRRWGHLKDWVLILVYRHASCRGEGGVILAFGVNNSSRDVGQGGRPAGGVGLGSNESVPSSGR